MSDDSPRITVQQDGPYVVQGGLPLVRKSAIVTEHGEPIGWRVDGEVAAPQTYSLCRCGQSANKPFCDDSHLRVGFDGTETASKLAGVSDREVFPGTGVVMRDTPSLCTSAGFCGNRRTKVWRMIADTDDTQVRAALMAMVERCPSGRLTYSLDETSGDIEPDLPTQIALLPDGPLWVTGGVAIDSADGRPYVARNRVTLCRCGASRNKPFCDGSHERVGFTDAGSRGVAKVDEAADAAGNGQVPAGASPSAGDEVQPGARGPNGDDVGRYLRYMAEFIGFSAAEADAVRRTKPLVAARLPDIVADFYQHLLRYPPTRAFFLKSDGSLDEPYLELRMQHQINFWLRTADAILDDDYARYVDFAGRAHTARGADPAIYIPERYVIGMVGFVQHAVSRALARELKGEDERELLDLASEAWNKLLMVILELLARAYGNERTAETFAPLVAVDDAAIEALAEDAYEAAIGQAEHGPLVEVAVAKVADIPDGERRIVQVAGLSLGIFHHRGQWVAIRNRCLHRGGPVATGPLDGDVLTCPWHGYQYRLPSGGCLTDPTAGLERYVVTARDGQLWVRVPTDETAAS